VGKSRLVSEFTARARAAGVRVLSGGCVELGTDGLPFAPFTTVLRELVRDLGADGVAGLLPGHVTRDFARLLPEFGPADGDAGGSVARARLFEQMLALLERLADSGPVASPSPRSRTRCTGVPRATGCPWKSCCALTAPAASSLACPRPCATCCSCRCGGCPRRPRRCSGRRAQAGSRSGTRCSGEAAAAAYQLRLFDRVPVAQ
jgi:hypothetical protein